MLDLPVKKIFGVGKVTNKKMQKLGIITCQDLQKLSREQLLQHFGKFGDQLYGLSRGQDDRPVSTNSIRKSISVEDTFVHDRLNLDACLAEIQRLYQVLITRLHTSQKKRKLPIKALYIKLRFNDFKTTTAQTIASEPDIFTYKQLITTAWDRGKRPVRLIGLGIQFDEERAMQQLNLPI
jgi:DNA polymerase-4